MMNLWKLSRQLNRILLLFSIYLLFLTGCNKTNMENIFITQYQKYPNMEIRDYYKLLYQAEFGVKHLLIDTLKSKQYLVEEYNSISAKNELLYEYISGDHQIIRVNLSSFKYRKFSIDSLFEVMKKSASLISSNEKSFLEQWSILKKLIEKGDIPLNHQIVSEYEKIFLNGIKEEHHSEIFINKYNPHYRVVLKEVFFSTFNLSK
jgi:hypothetical protein